MKKWGENKPELEVLRDIEFIPNTIYPIVCGLESTFGSMMIGGLTSTLSPFYEEMIAHDCTKLTRKQLAPVERELLRQFKRIMVKECQRQKVEHECMRRLPRDKRGRVARRAPQST
ncbi:MAG: hypothetical protein NTZ65_00620 [Candidatus Berkelbacteria bacterium]|nr:hypothetical protein [Candidatus Berkelbacteria bacterium]